MPPYESDSSDEGDDYTETNVLLGYASQEPTSDTVSHLGGHPTWPDDKSLPSGVLAKCRVCNDPLSLLLQLNGELPEQFPGHERRLYILSCRRRTCRRKEGSVRAIRAVRVAKGESNPGKAHSTKPVPNESKEEKKPQKYIGEAIFGVKSQSSANPSAKPFANPFSSNANDKSAANPFSTISAGTNPFAKSPPPPTSSPDPALDQASTTLPETFATKVRLSSPPPPTQPPRPHEPWPAHSFPEPFPIYHLDAEYETLEAHASPQIPSNARMDIDTEGSGGGGKEDKETFESTIDKTFQKFADRIGQNPEQVLRYEFRGNPLLYSDSDAIGKMLKAHSEHGSVSNAKITTTASKGGIGMPRCQNCGAERVFEVQLTPHAITELEVNEMGIEGMEWGTIILGVCTKDCKPSDVAEGDVGYLEEWCGVQWEEIAAKR